MDPVAAVGAQCCEAHGVDACTPGAVCALIFDARSISTCFELASRGHGEACGDTSTLCGAGLTCRGPDGGVCLFDAGSQGGGDDCFDADECADGLSCGGQVCRLGPVDCENVADCPTVDGILEVTCNTDFAYDVDAQCFADDDDDEAAAAGYGAVCVAEITGTTCPAAYPHYIIDDADTVVCSTSAICDI